MPFAFKVFGDKPAGGRSLYLSMHGGGQGPARVNDGQYENQKKLYQPAEGDLPRPPGADEHLGPLAPRPRRPLLRPPDPRHGGLRGRRPRPGLPDGLLGRGGRRVPARPAAGRPVRRRGDDGGPPQREQAAGPAEPPVQPPHGGQRRRLRPEQDRPDVRRSSSTPWPRTTRAATRTSSRSTPARGTG